jgi:DNA modification methylase
MSEPRSFLNGRVMLHAGDCLEVLKTFADNSIDSVVTDPPYHLQSIVKRFAKVGRTDKTWSRSGPHQRTAGGFMNKLWDGGDIAFQPDLWAEVLRVLKPGGYAVIFGGTRTAHRMVCAIEDAGFEIRDEVLLDKDSETEYRAFEDSLNDEQRRQFGKLFRERGAGRLSWQFGSGFPKSKNITASIDRCLCALPLAASVQVASIERTILQSSVSSYGDAYPASDETMRELRQGMDAEKPQASTGCESMLSGMRKQANFNQGDRPSFAALSEDNGGVRGLREAEDRFSGVAERGSEPSMLQALQRSSARRGMGEAWLQGIGCSQEKTGHVDGEESGMEGWNNSQAPTWELQRGSLREGTGMGFADGSEGPLHYGASACNGADVRIPFDESGSCQSRRPESIEQSPEQFEAISDECRSQARGSWPICGRCSKPIIPEGLGTALKPAHEPICMARKPFSEKTVAANVLRWGTGAINVGACKIGSEPITQHGRSKDDFGFTTPEDSGRAWEGRWPANLCHDNSEEVLACFPETGISNGERRDNNSLTSVGFANGSAEPCGFGDSGSAARFFASFPQDDECYAKRLLYHVKADQDSRLGSRHPTVKPLALIQYLVRLVTPKNGVCLDLFAGTGTTAEACFREGFKSTLIEREAEYIADVERRMSLVMEGPDTRAYASMKARNRPRDDGPLFGGKHEA